ncbi:MAG: HupE/UreJ family protein [Oscillatoriales cyanobacterium RM2_1_1]|nr:HupE/UreJ family protein [Oscillatoriales cyanobacterium SM2_3_0]NJO47603.1 HupE/UreJ family protein [Oscillatoriales cyanobacterium RM2_1_1]
MHDSNSFKILRANFEGNFGGDNRTALPGRVIPACLSLLIALFVTFLPAPSANAHGFQTTYLEIKETPAHQFEIRWKTPTNVMFGDETAGNRITAQPQFPERCQSTEIPTLLTTPQTHLTRWRLDCGSTGLVNQAISFPSLADVVEVLIRIQWADGHDQTILLQGGESSFTISEKPTLIGVGSTYLKLGINHIFSGIDHLLFVLGLVLIVGPSWGLVKTITAFTVAHSITLGAATLGLVQIPQTPVEAAIALSILFLATELAQSHRGKPGLTEKSPWLVALTFGLLHGFGFAGALSEVGLPQQDIPPALLFFNLGVEVGQLTFVLGVLLVWWSVQKSGWRSQPWVDWIPTYTIGTLASFWCIQRIVLFWGIS